MCDVRRYTNSQLETTKSVHLRGMRHGTRYLLQLNVCVGTDRGTDTATVLRKYLYDLERLIDEKSGFYWPECAPHEEDYYEYSFDTREHRICALLC